jgi:hypothetical protein
MQHPNETLATYYETPETLEEYACNMHVYTTSGSTFATSK